MRPRASSSASSRARADSSGVTRQTSDTAFNAAQAAHSNLILNQRFDARGGSYQIWLKLCKRVAESFAKEDHSIDEADIKNVIELGALNVNYGLGTALRRQNTKMIYFGLTLVEWGLRRGYSPSPEEELVLADAHIVTWISRNVKADVFNLHRGIELYDLCFQTIDLTEASSAELVLKYANALAYAGQFDRAFEVFLILVQKFEDHKDIPNFLFYTGCVLKAMGKHDEAADYFFEATQIGPPNLFSKLEMMFIISRNIEEGSKNRDVPLADAYEMVYEHVLLEGELSTDVSYEDWVSNAVTWRTLGDKCMLHNQFSLATDLYGQGIVRDRNSFRKAKLWYSFAKACNRCGRTSDAQLSIKQALSMDPFNTQLNRAMELWGSEDLHSPFEQSLETVQSLRPLLDAAPLLTDPGHLAASRMQAMLRGADIRQQVMVGLGLGGGHGSGGKVQRNGKVRQLTAKTATVVRVRANPIDCPNVYTFVPLYVYVRADWAGSVKEIKFMNIQNNEVGAVKLKYAFCPPKEIGEPRRYALTLSVYRLNANEEEEGIVTARAGGAAHPRTPRDSPRGQFAGRGGDIQVVDEDVHWLCIRYTDTSSGEYVERKLEFKYLHLMNFDPNLSSGDVSLMTPTNMSMQSLPVSNSTRVSGGGKGKSPSKSMKSRKSSKEFKEIKKNQTPNRNSSVCMVLPEAMPVDDEEGSLSLPGGDMTMYSGIEAAGMVDVGQRGLEKLYRRISLASCIILGEGSHNSAVETNMMDVDVCRGGLRLPDAIYDPDNTMTPIAFLYRIYHHGFSTYIVLFCEVTNVRVQFEFPREYINRMKKVRTLLHFLYSILDKHELLHDCFLNANDESRIKYNELVAQAISSARSSPAMIGMEGTRSSSPDLELQANGDISRCSLDRRDIGIVSNSIPLQLAVSLSIVYDNKISMHKSPGNTLDSIPEQLHVASSVGTLPNLIRISVTDITTNIPRPLLIEGGGAHKQHSDCISSLLETIVIDEETYPDSSLALMRKYNRQEFIALCRRGGRPKTAIVPEMNQTHGGGGSKPTSPVKNIHGTPSKDRATPSKDRATPSKNSKRKGSVKQSPVAMPMTAPVAMNITPVKELGGLEAIPDSGTQSMIEVQVDDRVELEEASMLRIPTALNFELSVDSKTVQQFEPMTKDKDSVLSVLTQENIVDDVLVPGSMLDDDIESVTSDSGATALSPGGAKPVTKVGPKRTASKRTKASKQSAPLVVNSDSPSAIAPLMVNRTDSMNWGMDSSAATSITTTPAESRAVTAAAPSYGALGATSPQGGEQPFFALLEADEQTVDGHTSMILELSAEPSPVQQQTSILEESLSPTQLEPVVAPIPVPVDEPELLPVVDSALPPLVPGTSGRIVKVVTPVSRDDIVKEMADSCVATVLRSITPDYQSLYELASSMGDDVLNEVIVTAVDEVSTSCYQEYQEQQKQLEVQRLQEEALALQQKQKQLAEQKRLKEQEDLAAAQAKAAAALAEKQRQDEDLMIAQLAAQATALIPIITTKEDDNSRPNTSGDGSPTSPLGSGGSTKGRGRVRGMSGDRKLNSSLSAMSVNVMASSPRAMNAVPMSIPDVATSPTVTAAAPLFNVPSITIVPIVTQTSSLTTVKPTATSSSTKSTPSSRNMSMVTRKANNFFNHQQMRMEAMEYLAQRVKDAVVIVQRRAAVDYLTSRAVLASSWCLNPTAASTIAQMNEMNGVGVVQGDGFDENSAEGSLTQSGSLAGSMEGSSERETVTSKSRKHRESAINGSSSGGTTTPGGSLTPKQDRGKNVTSNRRKSNANSDKKKSGDKDKQSTHPAVSHSDHSPVNSRPTTGSMFMESVFEGSGASPAASGSVTPTAPPTGAVTVAVTNVPSPAIISVSSSPPLPAIAPVIAPIQVQAPVAVVPTTTTPKGNPIQKLNSSNVPSYFKTNSVLGIDTNANSSQPVVPAAAQSTSVVPISFDELLGSLLPDTYIDYDELSSHHSHASSTHSKQQRYRGTGAGTTSNSRLQSGSGNRVTGSVSSNQSSPKSRPMMRKQLSLDDLPAECLLNPVELVRVLQYQTLQASFDDQQRYIGQPYSLNADLLAEYASSKKKSAYNNPNLGKTMGATGTMKLSKSQNLQLSQTRTSTATNSKRNSKLVTASYNAVNTSVDPMKFLDQVTAKSTAAGSSTDGVGQMNEFATVPGTAYNNTMRSTSSSYTARVVATPSNELMTKCLGGLRLKGYATGECDYSSHWKIKLESFCEQCIRGLVEHTPYTPLSVLKNIRSMIRSHPSALTEEEAFCALAESHGVSSEALGKINNVEYFSEIRLVCRILPVTAMLHELLGSESDRSRLRASGSLDSQRPLVQTPYRAMIQERLDQQQLTADSSGSNSSMSKHRSRTDSGAGVNTGVVAGTEGGHRHSHRNRPRHDSGAGNNMTGAGSSTTPSGAVPKRTSFMEDAAIVNIAAGVAGLYDGQNQGQGSDEFNHELSTSRPDSGKSNKSGETPRGRLKSFDLRGTPSDDFVVTEHTKQVTALPSVLPQAVIADRSEMRSNVLPHMGLNAMSAPVRRRASIVAVKHSNSTRSFRGNLSIADDGNGLTSPGATSTGSGSGGNPNNPSGTGFISPLAAAMNGSISAKWGSITSFGPGSNSNINTGGGGGIHPFLLSGLGITQAGAALLNGILENDYDDGKAASSSTGIAAGGGNANETEVLLSSTLTGEPLAASVNEQAQSSPGHGQHGSDKNSSSKKNDKHSPAHSGHGSPTGSGAASPLHMLNAHGTASNPVNIIAPTTHAQMMAGSEENSQISYTSEVRRNTERNATGTGSNHASNKKRPLNKDKDNGRVYRVVGGGTAVQSDYDRANQFPSTATAGAPGGLGLLPRHQSIRMNNIMDLEYDYNPDTSLMVLSKRDAYKAHQDEILMGDVAYKEHARKKKELTSKLFKN